MITLNPERALELMERAAMRMRRANEALADYKAARMHMRECRVAMREANKALRDFLAGKDDGQLPLVLNGNGAGRDIAISSEANTLGRGRVCEAARASESERIQ